ncbi:MAG TPA: phosphoserine phosphatase SerB, partial [Burkholderiales bacterium]|nr:phosphoserine phosphatase SerB [Burkholderiales bacterium]
MLNHLIIQGKNIATPRLKELARLAGADSIQAVTPDAFRLTHAGTENRNRIADVCEQAKLDYGFIPASRRIGDFKLVAMDMDSTLIAIECIDEVADMVGLKSEVAAITQTAMRGEIGFAESLTRRVKLLAGLEASALQRVYDERLRLSPGAERLLGTLQEQGIKTLLVSGGFTFFTERLQKRLNLDYSAANTLEIVNGKLTGHISGEILD